VTLTVSKPKNSTHHNSYYSVVSTVASTAATTFKPPRFKMQTIHTEKQKQAG